MSKNGKKDGDLKIKNPNLFDWDLCPGPESNRYECNLTGV